MSACKSCPEERALGTDAMFMCPGPGCECSDSGEECCCIRCDNDQSETACIGCGAAMRPHCIECGEPLALSPSDDEIREMLGPRELMPLWQIALNARKETVNAIIID